MEAGQYVPAGEPQKVRSRKPKTRNPTDQGIRDQQPPTVRKSNRGAPQQPEVADWGYDQYGNADPAQSYPEHYGYGTGEHVDAHAYGYGSAHLDAAGHGYGYGGAHAEDDGYGYDYGHGYPQADAGQNYGYGGAQVGAGQDYGYGGAQVDAGQDYGYGGAQVDAGQDYGYVAPTQQVMKVRNPRPVAGYENQGYEAYNAVAPSRNPEKRDAKPRKPSRSNGNHESPLASRALTGEREGPGSARSRTSQEGSRSNRSSCHHRASNRMEQDTNPEHRKQKVENAATIPPAANALNEHLRKAGGGKQPAFQDVSMAVFDPRDRTLMATPSLDEWMKKQGNVPKPQQDESLIVFDDHDKSELETRMFGAPLANSSKLPPVEEQQPQYQPRGPAGTKSYRAVEPAVEKPQYRPVRRYANSPGLPPAYQADHVQAGAIQEYNNVAYEPAYEGSIDNKQALQPVAPNAKCMACVHGIGVPLARLATRIACRQCWNAASTCGCTIL